MHRNGIFHGKLNYRDSIVIEEEISKLMIFENMGIFLILEKWGFFYTW
jgi:hypothetical protein